MAARRVNGALMANFVGSQVTLVGKVVANNGNSVVVETPDKKTATVHVTHDVPPEIKIVEFVGTVKPDGSLVEELRCSLTDNFDLDAYNEIVALANGAFSKAFYA